MATYYPFTRDLNSIMTAQPRLIALHFYVYRSEQGAEYVTISLKPPIALKLHASLKSVLKKGLDSVEP